MVLYPDLIWTALAAIGGYLLLRKKWSGLFSTEKWGVLLIFASFLTQVYWDILHQTATSKFVWNFTSQCETFFVTLVVVLGLAIGICSERKARK